MICIHHEAQILIGRRHGKLKVSSLTPITEIWARDLASAWNCVLSRVGSFTHIDNRRLFLHSEVKLGTSVAKYCDKLAFHSQGVTIHTLFIGK